MPKKGWSCTFDDPIPLPDGGELRTLRDAGRFIASLPKRERDAPEWQAAMQALLLVVEHGGDTILPRIGMMRALYPGEQIPTPRRKRAKKYKNLGCETHSLGPVVVFGVGDEASRHRREGISIHLVADRAWFAGRTAAAGWQMEMGLADQAAVVAARAKSHVHLGTLPTAMNPAKSRLSGKGSSLGAKFHGSTVCKCSNRIRLTGAEGFSFYHQCYFEPGQGPLAKKRAAF